ncbi:MAG: aconitate hydratase AcnA [Candidatus Hodarchaeales archaeon]|jgi:aconitate hydratase
MGILSKEHIKETKKRADFGQGECTYYHLPTLQEKGLVNLEKLPYSIRVLLENALRNYDGRLVTREGVESIMNWPNKVNEEDVPYMPARVVLQDFTGIPLIVDLADMRDTVAENGGDPSKINPMIPTDLVVDHSVQVDFYGTPDSFDKNIEREYQRNSERYKMIKWAQRSLDKTRVVPPGSGIVHQINLEYLASVIELREIKGEKTAVIDSVVGTDSHTPMVNGLGVIGWGVGGIEAEAVMLGQPYIMLLPEVIGIKLTGELPIGATATDLVLTVVEMLRKKGVVGKFVEYFGSGLSKLSVPDRATLSNMSPEMGCTIGYFPVDEATLAYLHLTGREEEHIKLIENYTKIQGLFRTQNSPDPEYSDVLQLDMGTVVPSLSGPANPEERVSIPDLRERVEAHMDQHLKTRKETQELAIDLEVRGEKTKLRDGDVVVAAITSCTNTSNPSVMVGAGLLAKKAVEKGLKVKPYVKTVLAPGSKAVTKYLENLGLNKYLEKLGYNLNLYGCGPCIGNTGNFLKEIENTIRNNDLYVTAVLSGNRNFGGRIHQQVRGNFLASPILVVAYALAGTTRINLNSDPLGHSHDGTPVYLKDIWPSQEEINEGIEKGISPEVFKSEYSKILDGDSNWQNLESSESIQYQWDPKSTYIRRPPYFDSFSVTPSKPQDIKGARVLLKLGDKVSTDHISPAGGIAKDSPAATYLIEHGIDPFDFNTYGARRGNHEVMVRGTYANVRVRNQLVPGKEGWWTKYLPTNEETTIYDASQRYIENKIPLIVLGGAQYGQGSSRDWGSKGPALLGVKAKIAKNYERIHRSNLIGMGVLPLQFEKGEGWEELGLDGTESFDILGISDGLTPKMKLKVIAKKNGSSKEFSVVLRVDSPVEVDYICYGGIMPYIVSHILRDQ